ncbi:hypothetical protein NQZ68_000829 [Dissostichus eleginoides]|nr:hypothetical protein NQZ68_000829 [Dissostichus eleginoides]
MGKEINVYEMMCLHLPGSTQPHENVTDVTHTGPQPEMMMSDDWSVLEGDWLLSFLCQLSVSLSQQHQQGDAEAAAEQIDGVRTEEAIGYAKGVPAPCLPLLQPIGGLGRALAGRFREFGSTSNRPHHRRPCVATSAQDHHIQHLHLQDRLRPPGQLMQQ